MLRGGGGGGEAGRPTLNPSVDSVCRGKNCREGEYCPWKLRVKLGLPGEQAPQEPQKLCTIKPD